MSTPLVILFTLISRALWTLSEVYVFQSFTAFHDFSQHAAKSASNFRNSECADALDLGTRRVTEGEGGRLDPSFIVRKKGNLPLQFWLSWKKVALFD